MKREFNLQLNEHMELLQDIAFKSINGIKVKEIVELRKLHNEDTYSYLNRIKLRYIALYGLLGLEYHVNQEIEKVLFSYITHLIKELPVENLNPYNEINISVSVI
ncbi:hypothetical protein AB1K84_15465 [Mesobacillus foraminis]|uniref:hypothetical protein n=1 Tax=Mesobacillus foraminis TaxID=279826 RepID=UPI00399FC84A